MQSVVENKTTLQRLIVSKEWRDWAKSAATAEYRDKLGAVQELFLRDPNYWNTLDDFLRITEPGIKLLRVADSNKAGSICQVYSLFAEYQAFVRDDEQLKPDLRDTIEQLLLDRWSQAHTIVHAAAHLLDPQVIFTDKELAATLADKSDELTQGLLKFLRKVFGTDAEGKKKVASAMVEYSFIRQRQGIFADEEVC